MENLGGSEGKIRSRGGGGPMPALETVASRIFKQPASLSGIVTEPAILVATTGEGKDYAPENRSSGTEQDAEETRVEYARRGEKIILLARAAFGATLSLFRYPRKELKT